MPPPNDSFANRIVLGGYTKNLAYSSSGATLEPGENAPIGVTRTVWFQYDVATGDKLYGVATNATLTFYRNDDPTLTAPTMSQVMAMPTGLGSFFDAAPGQVWYAQLACPDDAGGLLTVFEPVPGDWVQPDDQTNSVFADSEFLLRQSSNDSLNGPFDIQERALLSTFASGADEASRSSAPNGTSVGGGVYIYDFTTAFPPVSPTQPPGGLGVGYETPQGALVPATSVKMTGRILTGSSAGDGVNPGPRSDAYSLSSYDLSYDVVGGYVYPPGGDYIDFAGNPPATDIFLHETTSLFSVTASRLASDPAAQFPFTDLDVGGPDVNGFLLLALFPIPQTKPGNGSTSETTAALRNQVGGGLPSVSFTYRPPRARWYFDPADMGGVLKVLAEGVWRKVGCAPATVTGRLKLKGPGGQWYVEVCAGDSRVGAHPLKIEVDGAWRVVGCFRPV